MKLHSMQNQIYPVVAYTTDSHFLLDLDCWNYSDVIRLSKRLTKEYDLGDILVLKSGYTKLPFSVWFVTKLGELFFRLFFKQKYPRARSLLHGTLREG